MYRAKKLHKLSVGIRRKDEKSGRPPSIRKVFDYNITLDLGKVSAHPKNRATSNTLYKTTYLTNLGVCCRENDSGQLPRNVTQCCSGFCIDLLEKFKNDLGFTYELNRVDDPKFGTHVVNMKLLYSCR